MSQAKFLAEILAETFIKEHKQPAYVKGVHMYEKLLLGDLCFKFHQ